MQLLLNQKITSYENLRNKHFAREAIYIFFSLLSPVLQHTFCFYEFELADIQGWKNLEIVTYTVYTIYNLGLTSSDDMFYENYYNLM